MSSQENQNLGQFTNMPEMKMTPPAQTTPPAQMAPIMRDARLYRLTYPDVYYIVQPYVIMMCDEMDMYGPMMPTQDMIDEMTDNICEDVNRAHPDMGEYMCEPDRATQVIPFGNPDGFRRRPRRREFFRDFVSILLLSELFRRRRRFW